ncbi:MAG TPA: hypothetical protein VHM88_07245 [Candidatus Acidoferrales bacterium]|jgi:hypothetical protein|nr:hypothetical protein [Candidatus Acidoferrales bacterium]
MRHAAFFSLIVVLGGAGALVAQHEHHGMAHKVAAGVKLDEKTDATAKQVTLRLGPVNLPAHSNHMEVAQPPNMFWGVPFEGWLVAYHTRLVDEAGKAVPGRVLHHVGFWNTRRSDFLCPNKMEHIFGAGGELNDWPALPGYGYRVDKGDRIRIQAMFHNPTDTAYPKTYLEVRVEYRPRGAEGAAVQSVYPTWFDVRECHDSAYELEPGKSVTSGEITLRYSGRLLGVGGHLHDYGEGLVLEDLTRKQGIAELHAKLDADGRIVSMPTMTFVERGGYHLNQGERVRVTATYDSHASQPLPEGAMGIVVGYFVPDDDAQMAALRRPERGTARAGDK